MFYWFPYSSYKSDRAPPTYLPITISNYHEAGYLDDILWYPFPHHRLQTVIFSLPHVFSQANWLEPNIVVGVIHPPQTERHQIYPVSFYLWEFQVFILLLAERNLKSNYEERGDLFPIPWIFYAASAYKNYSASWLLPLCFFTSCIPNNS